MAKYTITIEDLGTINRVYYTLDGEDTEISPYNQEGNTITCEVDLPAGASLPQVDYVSSEVEEPALSLDTIGAVDIKSVTDENGNMLNYTVNENGTINVGDTVAAGTAISINYDLERIKIGALDFENGDKTRPTKYGMRIRNSQGEDVFTTADDGNITMTGTVNARAGEFSGNVLVGDSEGKYITMSTEIEDEPVIASSDYVQNNNQGWRINGSGDAVFNNITARGSLKTATFEYEEIEAVGGAFLFRPSSTIRNAWLSSEESLAITPEISFTSTADSYREWNFTKEPTFPAFLRIFSSDTDEDYLDLEITGTSGNFTFNDRSYDYEINGSSMRVTSTGISGTDGLSNTAIFIDGSYDLSTYENIVIEDVEINGETDSVAYTYDRNSGILYVTITEAPLDINSFDIIFSSSTDLVVEVEKPQFNIGDWVKLDNFKDDSNMVAPGLAAIYKVNQVTYEEDGATIIENPSQLILEGAAEYYFDNYTDLIGGALISLGQEDLGTGDELDNYGIGINSGDGDILLPPRAISLFESTINPEASPKVSFDYTGILGTLPDSTMASLNVNSSIYDNMIGTQGIYTDNMYIGDASQYVAFYTDQNTQEKKLDISAQSLSVGVGIDNPLYLVGDSEGVALYRGIKVDNTGLINTNNIFLTDNNIQIRNGQTPLAIFENDSIKLSMTDTSYMTITSNSQEFYYNADKIYNFNFNAVPGERVVKDYNDKDHRLVYNDSQNIYSGNLLLENVLESGESLEDFVSLTIETAWNEADVSFSSYFNRSIMAPFTTRSFELINGTASFDTGEEGAWTFSYDNNDNNILINLNNATKKIRSVQTKNDLNITSSTPKQSTTRIFTGTIEVYYDVKYDGYVVGSFKDTFTAGMENAVKHTWQSMYFSDQFRVTYTPTDGNTADTFTFETLRGDITISNLCFFAYFDAIFLSPLRVNKIEGIALPCLDVGPYPKKDDNINYAFILGNGTSDEDQSSVFGIDWNGKLYLSSSIIKDINNQWSVDMASLQTTTPSTSDVTVSATSGQVNSFVIRRFGNIVNISLNVQNTSSTPSGQNIFTGQINGSDYYPAINVTGSSYNGARIAGAFLNVNGVITLRNTMTTACGAGTGFTFSFTYIVE